MSDELLTPFDGFLSREPHFKGLDDFVRRLPFLCSQKVTQCGSMGPRGYWYGNDEKGKVEGELSDSMDIMGARLFWGSHNNVGVRTRLELRFLSAISEPDYRVMAIESMNESLLKYLSDSRAVNLSDSRFGDSELCRQGESFSLIAPLTNSGDSFDERPVRYFKPYWTRVMSPIIASMIKLSNRAK